VSHLSQDWTNHFAELAILCSTRSKDPERRVGAVIVDNNRCVVGMGYNGFPRGVVDDPERYANRQVKLSMVVHAEANAILNARVSVCGCALLCTSSPCSECVKLIIQSGIDVIIAPKLQPDSKWVDDNMIAQQMLAEAGVLVEEIVLPRHGLTHEEYYENGLRLITKDLHPEHRASCVAADGQRTTQCECLEPMIDMADDTISRLLRGKSV
jgi:dCMP deaminase